MLLRSLLYNLAFYTIVPLYLIVMSPLLLAPRRTQVRVVYVGLSRLMRWLLGVIVGLKVEPRGLANLRQGPCIVAVKHQSAWDIFGIIPFFDDPAIVYKSELKYLPLMGWFAAGMELIPVERGKGQQAIKHLATEARKRVRDKREIVIFPEGHRMPVGAPPKYKRGIVALYKLLNVPVVPVALNSGLYWRRRHFIRRPGSIIVEFLPAIEPGLEPEVFLQTLQDAIEPACDRLVREALAGPNPPPKPESFEM
jgi:1-acyl-sn-glycerol-3-phosphate acyltransferase